MLSERLVKYQSNAMSYYFIEKIHDDNISVLVDWDLSAQEEEKLINDFEKDILEGYEKERVDVNDLFGREVLAIR